MTKVSAQWLDHYEFTVTWSGEDGEYVGTCLEFPSLSHLAASRSAALEGIVDLVANVVEDLLASQELVPEPIATRQFSGKFQLRTSPQTHAMLVREAARQGISLNALANLKLVAPAVTNHQ